MAHALARPHDILVAYDPDTVSVGNQPDPLEVHGGRRAFREMTGGADTYHEDFTSGLRDFVAARQAAGGFDDPGGGSTLVGGWFGGAGADPSALVVGLDWLAENRGGDGAAEDGVDERGLSPRAVSAPPPVRRPPETGDLSAFIRPTRGADGLEAALAASGDDEAAAPPRVADLSEMVRDIALPEEGPGQPRPGIGRSVMGLGAADTSTAPRLPSAEPIEDGFVVIPAAVKSLGAGQPAWDLGLGAPGPVTTMGAGPRKEAE